jgi:hypothetical protein
LKIKTKVYNSNKSHSNKIHLFYQMIRLNHSLIFRNLSINKVIKFLIILQIQLSILLKMIFKCCHSLIQNQLMTPQLNKNSNLKFRRKQSLNSKPIKNNKKLVLFNHKNNNWIIKNKQLMKSKIINNWIKYLNKKKIKIYHKRLN